MNTEDQELCAYMAKNMNVILKKRILLAGHIPSMSLVSLTNWSMTRKSIEPGSPSVELDLKEIGVTYHNTQGREFLEFLLHWNYNNKKCENFSQLRLFLIETERDRIEPLTHRIFQENSKLWTYNKTKQKCRAPRKTHGILGYIFIP